jgi:hypothetical protein
MKGRQIQIILTALQGANGGWVPALALHEQSGSLAVHSRIADLRKRGHRILNRTRHEAGRCHSEYCLADIPGLPPRGLAKTGALAASESAPKPTGQAEFPLPLAPASKHWPD